jgi:hypothetical protein
VPWRHSLLKSVERTAASLLRSPLQCPSRFYSARHVLTRRRSVTFLVRLSCVMSRIGSILSHRIEVCGKFWRAFTGRESNQDLIEREEVRLQTLRVAIGLYHAKYGRFPEILRDLCDNNYDDPEWDGPFITWSGEDTFRDSFGYRYEYEAVPGRSRVVSPGLERAKGRAAELGASPTGDPARRAGGSGVSEGPPSVSR